jgi:lipase
MAVLNLHHYGAPDGAPTLAVHGVTAHGERYRRLAQEAFPERRWLAVDLRGHGRSTWDGPWTVEQHVADLLETLDAEGVERVEVVGHSYGGMIGLHLLATAPERVARLALLDPAIELPGEWLPRLADELIEDPGWATPEEALAKRIEGRVPQSVADATEDVQRHLHLAPDGRWRMRFCRGAAIAGWSEMARRTVSVAHASRPVLLVVAKQEEIVRPELRASLARDLGDRLATVELDCGHMVYWDSFDETASALRAFLSSAA